MDAIAPLLAVMTITITLGAVLVLRPIAKHLGELLDLRVRQGRGEIDDPRVTQLEQTLDSLTSRIHLLEERQDFTDSLLRSANPTERLGPRDRHQTIEAQASQSSNTSPSIR